MSVETPAMQTVSADLYVEIADFLFYEVALLENNRLDEWLDLFTDDVRYEMPVRRNPQPRASAAQSEAAVDAASFALFHDDKGSLAMRVRRIATGIAHAELPASVTQRLITNVRATHTANIDEFDVDSRFLVYQERRGRHHAEFLGARHDRIRRDKGRLRIAARRIKLAQTVLPTTISIFF